MTATDGKKRLTDVANTEQLLRIIQSIPSPKAEPFKQWLAQVGRERIEEPLTGHWKPIFRPHRESRSDNSMSCRTPQNCSQKPYTRSHNHLCPAPAIQRQSSAPGKSPAYFERSFLNLKRTLLIRHPQRKIVCKSVWPMY